MVANTPNFFLSCARCARAVHTRPQRRSAGGGGGVHYKARPAECVLEHWAAQKVEGRISSQEEKGGAHEVSPDAVWLVLQPSDMLVAG